MPRVSSRALLTTFVVAALPAMGALTQQSAAAAQAPQSIPSHAASSTRLAATSASFKRASRGEARAPITPAFPSPQDLLTGTAGLGTPISPVLNAVGTGGAAGATPLAAASTAVAASVAAAKPKKAAGPRWVRPNGGPFSSPFGMRWGRMHSGIDLAGGYGSPILAATDGVVLYAGPEQGYGRVVKIQDSDGTQTWYGHMSRFLIRAGDHVKAGQRIALVGAAGDATGPHLHFEVRIGGRAVNPLPFLRAHGVRI